MGEAEIIDIRLECLRLAVENGSARDMKEPHLLAERYFQWVIQGSEDSRPEDSRKDDSPMRANKSRGVRKGSTLQS